MVLVEGFARLWGLWRAPQMRDPQRHAWRDPQPPPEVSTAVMPGNWFLTQKWGLAWLELRGTAACVGCCGGVGHGMSELRGAALPPTRT